ncbi:MAG: Spy/CpxP family protein refolding chaperone [Candidatus Sulfotelmatobacter sp.]
MKTIRFRFLIAALTVLLGTAIAKSQTAEDTPPPPPMHGHHDGMGGPMGHFFAAKLNLTDEQKAQAKSIWEKERPTVKPLMQQERQLDMQLRQYVEGNFDQAKVQAIAAQKAQVQTQLTVEQTRIHNEMYQLLTADQKTQLKQLEAQHEARMQQRMQQHSNDEPPAPPEQ